MKKSPETNTAVSSVVGVILIVAITVAIAATIFFQYTGTLNGVKDYTASIGCITDSSTDRITITTVSPIVKWSDIGVAVDNTSVNWQVYNSNHIALDVAKSTIGAVVDIGAGDYIQLDFSANPGMSGNVNVNVLFIPTNTLLGSWVITV